MDQPCKRCQSRKIPCVIPPLEPRYDQSASDDNDQLSPLLPVSGSAASAGMPVEAGPSRLYDHLLASSMDNPRTLGAIDTSSTHPSHTTTLVTSPSSDNPTRSTESQARIYPHRKYDRRVCVACAKKGGTCSWSTTGKRDSEYFWQEYPNPVGNSARLRKVTVDGFEQTEFTLRSEQVKSPPRAALNESTLDLLSQESLECPGIERWKQGFRASEAGMESTEAHRSRGGKNARTDKSGNTSRKRAKRNFRPRLSQAYVDNESDTEDPLRGLGQPDGMIDLPEVCGCYERCAS